jgi:hypothetical protein
VSVNVAVEWVSSLRHSREFAFQISISIPVFMSVVFRSFRYPVQANARISPCSKPRPLFPTSIPIHDTDNSTIWHYVGLTWGTGNVFSWTMNTVSVHLSVCILLNYWIWYGEGWEAAPHVVDRICLWFVSLLCQEKLSGLIARVGRGEMRIGFWWGHIK